MNDRAKHTYQYLDHSKGKVAYLKFGKGQEPLIALHGFSDRGRLFENLEEGLGGKYTVYAIDFPFHGSTKWQTDFFEPKDVLEIIQLLLEKAQSERFSLMAYSMGGRVTQVILASILPQLNQLYFIAPDGIDTKWMFDVNRVPFWSIQIMKRWLRRPETFFKLLRWLNKRGFLSKFLHDFAYSHIKSPERRMRLLCTWASVKRFQPEPDETKNLLRESRLPTRLYFGKRDEVIPPRIGVWLSEGLPNVELNLLNEGHLLIDQELNDLLKEQLTKDRSNTTI